MLKKEEINYDDLILFDSNKIKEINTRSVIITFNSFDNLAFLNTHNFNKVHYTGYICEENNINNNFQSFKFIRINCISEKQISILKKIKNKNNFLEVIIPIEVYTNNQNKNNANLIKQLSFADRLIVDFEKEKDYSIIQQLFSDLTLYDFFPFVKNIPMCKVNIEHCFELYNKKGCIEKECKSCTYKTHCSYNKNEIIDCEKINIKPVEKNIDFENFVRENETTINRI